MRQKFIFFIIIAVVALSARAVEPYWDVDMQSVFDNREGVSTLTGNGTIVFTALEPELGLRFSKKDRIGAGVAWIVPDSRNWDVHHLEPTLYYRHTSHRWNMSMGLFPRTQLHQELPEFLWSDSLTYFQKNIRGMLVQYHNSEAFVDLYLDWRQMQTHTRREAFNIVLHGRWKPKGKVFVAGGHAMMNHYAKTKNPPPDMFVIDNFLVNPYVGLDSSRTTPLDTLAFRAGPVMNIERNRRFGNWTARTGFNFEAMARWKWIGLREVFYVGQKLLPEFAEFGSGLYPGHPFYQERMFNRTDLDVYIYDNKYVDIYARLRLDVAPGQLSFSQMIGVDIAIDGLFRKQSPITPVK